MKPDAILLLLSTFLLARPGYHYYFPVDHFNHSDYQTEWWYYTGNLHDSSGHRYGFELTFFRQAIQLPQTALESSDPIWRPDQIYLAHLALTDIDARQFFHTERLNRAGPGIAGSDITSRKYWNGNWQVYWKNLTTGEQQLQAVCDRFTLTLNLLPLKRPIINGQDGISQKGPAIGEASHYISFTRLSAQGTLIQHDPEQQSGRAGLWPAADLQVSQLSGLAWMDHEFFTEAPNPTLAGWDWFSIQLRNNEELMLYRLRDKSGAISPYSSGTYVDSSGVAHHLAASQVTLKPGRVWHKYPVDWQIAIPSLGLDLSEQTTLDNQELSTQSSPSPTYWEGAVTYSGTLRQKSIQGVGYLEMTGYTEPIRLGH
jgi:predicted secreted hydrolase